MNVLNTQRRLLLGSAVGALALRPSRTVKADTTFTNFSFAATGAPAGVKRTLPDRLSEVINVKDWGAVGNGSADDSGPIQNAVTHAILQGGGKVFFPPGNYAFVATGNLVVGNASLNSGVQLIGSSRGCTAIHCNISKGGLLFDNLERIQDLTIGGSTVMTRAFAVMVGCGGGASPFVDTSGGQGISVWDTDISTSQNNPAGTVSPGPPAGSIGFNVGNGTSLTNCRATLYDIAYAVSGGGVSIFSCSAEVNNTGVRVGWSNGVETVASGCSIQNFQTERCATSVDLYNCIGCVIAGNILTGGDGTPGPTHGRISSMTWAAGSPPLVTVTTTGNHNIAGNTYQAANLDGTYTLQLEVGGGGGGLNPLGYCPPATQPVHTGDESLTIRVTVTGATTFTYPGVPSNPGAFVHGEWNYPLRYAIRCRTVKETLISANQVPVAVGFASVDLDYGGTAATQHRNNVFIGLDGPYGWILPSATKNLAGWKFIGCSGKVPSYGNVDNPFRAMKFGD